MRDVGVAQRVQIELGIQTGGIAGLDERLVQRPGADPAAPFGDPQGRVLARVEQWPDLVQPLRQRVDDPVHLRHQQHRAAFRRTASRRLAPPHEQGAELAELASLRVAAQVRQIQAPSLAPAQPERVDGLEHRRVPQGGQRAFAAALADLLDPGVCRVEQRLDLVVGQRPTPGAALVVDDVDDAVRLVQHLLRDLTEALGALLHPAVPVVRDELQEQPQLDLIGPRRGHRDRAFPAAQSVEESLHLRGAPLPRVQVREVDQAAHQG